MLDMTNDSERFRTEQELIVDGAYRVSGHRWEKGDAWGDAPVFVEICSAGIAG
jgi:hypothetical protein